MTAESIVPESFEDLKGASGSLSVTQDTISSVVCLPLPAGSTVSGVSVLPDDGSGDGTAVILPADSTNPFCSGFEFVWSASYEYYGVDHLGTVRAVVHVDAGGNEISTALNAYSPFGIGIPPEETSDNTHRFTGQERDPETNNDYFHFRYYASSMGRFLKPDNVSGSAMNPQDWNLYSYVHGNPVNLNDPTGHNVTPSLKYTYQAGLFSWDSAIGGYSWWGQAGDFGDMQTQSWYEAHSTYWYESTDTTTGNSFVWYSSSQVNTSNPPPSSNSYMPGVMLASTKVPTEKDVQAKRDQAGKLFALAKSLTRQAAMLRKNAAQLNNMAMWLTGGAIASGITAITLGGLAIFQGGEDVPNDLAVKYAVALMLTCSVTATGLRMTALASLREAAVADAHAGQANEEAMRLKMEAAEEEQRLYPDGTT